MHSPERIIAEHFGWTNIELSECGLIGISPVTHSNARLPKPLTDTEDCRILVEHMCEEGWELEAKLNTLSSPPVWSAKFRNGGAVNVSLGTDFRAAVVYAAARALEGD